MWDSTPPRPVTTHDVVRAFKRMGNPVLRPATIGYFTSTIRGMAEYRANYAEAMAGRQPAAQELAAYQDSHDIPGVFALDDETMIFELVRPALDFITMLALPEASPVPVEYDQYLPGSPELHANLRSNGPYRIVRYTPGSVRLEPNPVWRRETDPVRQQLLDAVEVTTGSGTADLGWGLPATTASGEPPRHRLGQALDPYLVLNMSTLDNPDVRRAIAYAVDKAAIAEVFDQHKVAGVRVPARSMIPPGNVGHRDDFDPYPTDPHHARTLLPTGGVTVTVLCRDTELDLSTIRLITASR
jgi:peptide/nickel transport system substrate-binding protein